VFLLWHVHEPTDGEDDAKLIDVYANETGPEASRTTRGTAMQKTIITLWGISNLGKTMTIRLAYEDLRKEGRCIDPGRPSRKEVKAAILEIDGVNIGFASPGDKPGILEENLELLIAAGCIVIVCATHTRRSKTVEVVKRLASQSEPAFNIVWIEKACQQADHDSGNRQKADEIIMEVRRAIANAQPVEA
jgi:hypothetical protein